MWYYKKTLKIKWTDKFSNSKILDKIGIGNKIWKAIVKKKVRMIGHNPR